MAVGEDLKQWALTYAGLGWAVFPLKPKSKTPATKNGFKDATKDVQQVKAWWDTCPSYNIGIATGSASGGLFVIDLDTNEDKGINGYEVLRDWEGSHGELPETVTSITGGGGYHFLYTGASIVRNRVSLYEGVDIRGEGGYIVAPPSIHENGRRYEWENEPLTCQVAQATNAVFDFIIPQPQEQKQNFQTPERIPGGERNSTLFKQACSMRNRGDADEAIRAALEATNAIRCNPPLEEKELDTILNSALKYESGTTPYRATCKDGMFHVKKDVPKAQLISFTDIQEETVSWLYDPYVPLGKLTLVAAYPGTGKTFLMCYMAACVSTGRQFFDIVPFAADPGKVLYLSAEDGAGDTLKARLRMCGADMKNVFTVERNGTVLTFDSPYIEEYIAEVEPSLVVFDPLQAYIGADVEMNAANKTREKLENLLVLAERYNTAIVIVCHFNKNQKGDAITRILGSTDIVGACRSYLALGSVPGDEGIKYMSHEKSSLAKKGTTQLFEINPAEGGIKPMGESNLSMDDYTALKNKEKARSAPAQEAAEQFLLDQMPEGKRKASELINLAKANHISESALKRAKRNLGIVSKQEGFKGHYIWYMPGGEMYEEIQNKLPI